MSIAASAASEERSTPRERTGDVVSGAFESRGRVPRIPLRITLVALLVGLVTLALLATGFATQALLRGYLQGQLDSQLRATASEAQQDPRLL